MAELAHPPTTKALAERLGISRPTLDRAFASEIGISPARFLARLRLDEAKRLLRASALPATDIARQLGYCNSAYFSNLFRETFGLSPREWRRQRAR